MILLEQILARTAGWPTDDERFEELAEVLEYLDDLMQAAGLDDGDVLFNAPTAAIGFATGAGGAVTQETDATTGVELNKPCGQITTVALNQAAAAEVTFTVTNSTVAATDVIILSPVYAGAGTLVAAVTNVAAGEFDITLTNLHASAAFDALAVINFVVIKGVAA